MSAHSFLAEPSGSMAWGAPIRLNYMGGSNVTERWDAYGPDRSGNYDGALLVATFGDFEVGTYPPDSAEGIDELQHLYWYALTAQAKGCRLMVVYPIWTPPGPPTSWDNDTMARTIAKTNWLNARPEITLTVVTAPTPILARQLEAYYAPTSIWRDGLHMVDPPVPGMRAIRGMGLMVHSMLTGARYAGAAIDAEDGVMADMAWAVVRDYACTGLGGATVIAPYPLPTDPLPSPLPLPHPLQPYFDSGTIQIYLDSDGATLNGGGAVTAITNRGAGGAAFNATVSGVPIPLTGNTMQMSGSVGNPILATPASIDGVRMMWVCSLGDATSSMRFMGSATDEIRLGAIQAGSPPSAFLQFWSNRTGSGVSTNPTPRILLPASGLHLIETEVSVASQYQTAWLDGPQVATAGTFPHAVFQIDRIGQGTGSSNQFIGQLGGVLGVVTGQPDTAAAVAAVRAYWATRFGLTMT